MLNLWNDGAAKSAIVDFIAVYTIGVYWVFRGKVRKGYGRGTAAGV